MKKVENVHQKKLIVLIEDEEIIVNLLGNKLEKAGYVVKAAQDGLAGLELIDRFQPDLVLLDMLLPRLSGFGVIEKLNEKKLLPKIPVIIISNSGQPIEIERALKLGVRDYLIKVNFDPSDVVSKVDHILTFQGGQKEQTRSEASGDAPFVNVLIIEDDLFLVDLLERKFAQEQYRVYGATDVQQARRFLEDNDIDVILLDLVLPGVDGFTFLTELKTRAKWKDIPVIIISNLGQAEEVERGLKAGAVDYVVKAHTSPDQIVKKVETLIKKLNSKS